MEKEICVYILYVFETKRRIVCVYVCELRRKNCVRMLYVIERGMV